MNEIFILYIILMIPVIEAINVIQYPVRFLIKS